VNRYPRNGAVFSYTQAATLREGFALQRLFSMFPNGFPGAGLLLLRLVCSALTISGAARTIIAAPSLQTVVLSVTAFGASLLLLAGLWTPIAGICVSLFEAWAAVSRFTGMEVAVLLATLGVALAALGPGAHSIDARLYGRKRIEIQHD
jgi:putative oxidoreductase